MNFTLAQPLLDTRPKVLRDIGDRLCELLEHKPLKLHDLHGTKLLPRWQARRMTPRRPELREAIGLVARAMLEHTDIDSKRVGAPRSDGRVVPPGQQGRKGHEDEAGLVWETGLPITRVRRAIGTMVRIGWLRGPRKGPDGHFLPGPSGKRYQRVEEYDDVRPGAKPGAKRYHAHRVVYVFTDEFFAALGKDIVEKFAEAQADSAKRRAERRARLYPAALLAGRELHQGMRHGSRETRPPGAPGAPARAVSPPVVTRQPSSTDAAENAARRTATLKIRLRERHPDWGAAKIEATAAAIVHATRPR